MRRETSRAARLAVFCLAVWLLTALCASASAGTVTLKPGDDCDVSAYGKNTKIVISSAGDYTLRGASSTAWVEVTCGGVNLYLADGLRLDCGINANTGKTAPAIRIEENGGTVRLISKKNAEAYLSGYLTSPAIQKEGTKTKLVFETEDPDAPGTIVAYSAPGSSSAGIGSVYHLLEDGKSCGNMVFNSGNVTATGGSDSAGIGGGSGKARAVDIVINGGHIIAKGNGAGAGIGGGMCCGVDRITVNGGVIEASSRNGAAIGGGQSNSTGDGARNNGTITINGGKITATTSWMGAGIGSGASGNIDSIIIRGGEITAESTLGCGIGSDGNNLNGTCGSIEISGGKITATASDKGESPAIGSGLCGSGDTKITISGGEITARGANGWYAIGGGGKSTLFNSAHLYVDISGGTVNTIPNNYKAAIGGEEGVTCTVTGGALLVRDIKGTPTDGHGNKVIFATVEVYGVTAGQPVTDAVMEGLARPYGLKDAKTMDGDSYGTVFYCWLPVSSVVTGLTVDGTVCTGTFRTDRGVDPLHAQTKIIIKANGGQSDGLATVAVGDTKVTLLQEPVWEGYSINGYTLDQGSYVENWLFSTQAGLVKNVAPYTDADGRWLQSGGTVTVYPFWYWDPAPTPPPEFTYTIHFDENYPPQHWGFSIENIESMQDMTVHEGQTGIQLKPCGWTLFMFEFAGWNTSPDGRGQFFADGATIPEHLTRQNGATVKLYAQWLPSNEEPPIPRTGDGFSLLLWALMAVASLTALAYCRRFAKK